MDMSISKHSMDIYRYIEISVYIHDIQMLELPDVFCNLRSGLPAMGRPDLRIQ